MAIFFTIVVVVVGPEQRKEVCGLDLGREIWLAMQALRPTNSLRRCAQVVDIWKMSSMYSNSISKKIVSFLPNLSLLGFEPRTYRCGSKLNYH